MFIHCSIFEEKYSEKRKVVFDCGNSSSSSSTKMTTEDTTSWDDGKLTHKYSAWKQAERAIMQSRNEKSILIQERKELEKERRQEVYVLGRR